MIPISVVDLGEGTEDLVLQVLRSGHLAQGPMVAEFERRFAELIGVAHAVAVNNGTTALIAALQVLDLQPGDEVITSPFTFVATLNAILEAGATVRFADIGTDDFSLDPAAVAEAVTDRTKVLMPVHLYGQCADLDALDPLVAAATAWPWSRTAAQAHGATIGDRRAGAFGLGCFSFYATKNLTTGEGGMITTDDDRLADRLRVLRNQGMRARYQYEMAGHNYRMTDLQAALALPQLDRYAANVEARGKHAAALVGRAGRPARARHPGGAARPRPRVAPVHRAGRPTRPPSPATTSWQSLQAAGVGCGVYYPALVFDYDCYRDHPLIHPADVPVAARTTTEVLSLPVHPRPGPGRPGADHRRRPLRLGGLRWPRPASGWSAPGPWGPCTPG